MFLRLLIESFRRQKRRKALAGAAILLGTTAVTAMLALALGIGDRIHRELAVYGANIVVTPRAADLAVNIGGVDLHPATGHAFLHESDLTKLQTIFWHNNITAISPELPVSLDLDYGKIWPKIAALGVWFPKLQGPAGHGGAPALHPWWKLTGAWPVADGQLVVGTSLASRLGLHLGSRLGYSQAGSSMGGPGVDDARVVGIVATGDETDQELLLPLDEAQRIAGMPSAISRIDIAARTRPEDAFARVDPDSLSPAKRDLWYCRPYANSIAYQIREAIPGADAQQVRRVEQSEGTVLSRISGLLWLVSAAALLAAAFAVSAAMATAVLERRREIGLMRSLGAGKAAIASLFYAESSLLAILTGALGFLLGSILAHWLGGRVFPDQAANPGPTRLSDVFNPVLLPIVIGLALLVAIAGSTPAIREALSADPGETLRGSL